MVRLFNDGCRMAEATSQLDSIPPAYETAALGIGDKRGQLESVL